MSSKLSLTIIILVSIFLAFFISPMTWDKGADFLNNKLGIADNKYKVPHFFGVPGFRLGLDLQGGVHLEYEADLSQLAEGQSTDDAMSGVRDVIERRVNLFGVSEPVVQIVGKSRLVVELAGITDVNQAIALIGQTPFLEFKEQRPEAQTEEIVKAQEAGKRLNEDPYFIATGLTGRNLKRSTLVFDPTTGQPQVSMELDEEGTRLFAELTKRNLGKPVAIYLDGQPISIPIVQSEIVSGEAVISGQFTAQMAKDLANRLNAGALPVPVELVSQQSIGASLGTASLNKSLKAGLYALLAVAVFMILFYRLPGVAAVLALIVYTVIVLSIFKAIPVTITLAGIAGFILSLGIAVDANVLIFSRLREELKAGRTLPQAINEGFGRAWLSIRDSHVTTLLGALVLYLFTTSIVKGFALTLGIGVLTSLFSSIVVTRGFVNLIDGPWFERKKWFF